MSGQIQGEYWFSWKKMPEPKAIVSLSWEDIIDYAESYTQEHFNRNPKRNEIIEIFDSIDSTDWDCDYSTFWGEIKEHVYNYYEDVSN